MKFWEVFFSSDKIIYPLLITIAFGIFIKVLSLITKTELKDEIIICFMTIGFVIGNVIKTNKIIDEYEKQQRMNKKVKNQSLKSKSK